MRQSVARKEGEKGAKKKFIETHFQENEAIFYGPIISSYAGWRQISRNERTYRTPLRMLLLLITGLNLASIIHNYLPAKKNQKQTRK